MEYELLQEIDAQYLIEYLDELNSTILEWKSKMFEVYNEYNEIKEYDSSNIFELESKKEKLEEYAKLYYNEVYNKMKRTKLEISSIYSYIIKDKMFLEIISDKELIAYFRECATISEEISKSIVQMRQLNLSSKNVKEYKKGYQYNLLDIKDDFYSSYNDEVESLYFEDAIDYYKTVNSELKKSIKGILTLKKMIKSKAIVYR
jgi:hypothetical protein